ncbi:MAG: LPS export ABC transporter permease LptF [Paracoccaceae bacterium]
MARIDRYMLSQMLWLFGFCALVLVAIFWINRGVVLFDRLIGDGQTALVFLEFTALSLPTLIARVLPIAAFCASVYVTNRLNNESELTVMLATGASPWRLARPVFLFGLVVASMMAILTNTLVPTAQAQLTEREAEISRNLTSRLLTEGTFLSPTENVTFYTREIGEDGVLRDVFLSDRRNPSERVMYTAAEAYLLRDENSTTLIMVDGLAQRLSEPGKRLSTSTFQDFSFDILPMMDSAAGGFASIRHLRSLAFLENWDEISEQTGASRGAIAEELHSRFAQPLFCLVVALVGFATLLVSGYSRFGVWREIAIAFGLLLIIDGMRGVLIDFVLEDAWLWPLMYMPSLIGLTLALGMLGTAARPGWWRIWRSAPA